MKVLELLDFIHFYIGPSTLRNFLLENAGRIDWDKLADWAEKNWEKDGYEWLREIDNNGPESWKDRAFREKFGYIEPDV